MSTTQNSERPLRSVHVGVGGRGRVLLQTLSEHPDYLPTALVDTDPAVLARGAALVGARKSSCYPDLDEAFAATKADVAVIATPSRYHADHVRRALKAGLHVFVEKPFVHSLTEAAELVELAEGNGRQIIVGQQYRYEGNALALRGVIESGKLGMPRYGAFTHHRRRWDVGAFTMPHAMIVEMSVHHFDNLRAWTGTDAASITATSFDPPWSEYHGGAVSGLLHFGNGVEIVYLGTFTSHADYYDVRLECDHGVAGWDERGVYTNVNGDHTSIPPVVGKPALQRVIGELTAAIKTGAQSPISGRSNLGTLAMVEAAIESSTHGKPWPVPNIGESVDRQE